MSPERPSPITIFGPEWNRVSIMEDFNNAGIIFTPKENLSNPQIVTCPVGRISLENGKYVEEIDFLKEENGSYFVRGIKNGLFQQIEEHNLGIPIKLDNEPENIYGVSITNSESLKRLVDIVKTYYRLLHQTSTSIPTGQ
ncbi:MAG: hypothetical protein Q8P53_03575 [Candidatus Shapirobacteria bacterium]|nr:hypothetical protein [Candidatus Shapirobacteria bacterium]